MEVPVYSLNGEVVDQIHLSQGVFGLPFNEAVVHQAMARQLANRRQGTASTKARSEVTGSTRKLYAQKHTGRARRGDVKSPLLRGGGVVFGPRPRTYRQSMPKKMRRLALKCLLSAKVREGNMRLVQELDFDEPRTRDMMRVLSSLGSDSSTLILTAQSTPGVVKSAANLHEVKVLPSALINVLDLLSYKMLIATVPAIRNIEQIWGE
ncbi:MAG: 50S ribosomal protein L4 [Chloroflexi bacterium]|nr:50S ribosomal protein L4 [Chloroflexota bacterium]MCK4843509.1 50S ribosomal protein L4 [Dehalococcoidia bacterium]TET55759.1 MAG: 50S ribosomal protein L4 [Dehalococcoidia bacterium]